MRTMWMLVVALALAVPVIAEQAMSDEEQLKDLVLEYTRLEDAVDMQTQSNFMAADRVWVGIGGRRTDNALWMKVQDESFQQFQQRFPGVKIYREVRDLHIRLMGSNAAITSFTWAANRIIPADLPAEKVEMLGRPPIPTCFSVVWEKQGNTWKIVHTHVSPLYLRQ